VTHGKVSIRPSSPTSILTRTLTIASLSLLLVASGCKTSEDSTAAATQMAATSKALAAYYTTLHKRLEQTDHLYAVQEAILSIPYSDADKSRMADAAAEIEARAKMADKLAELSESFGDLASPDTAKAASTSAAALGTELETIKSLQPASSTIDTLTGATQFLVTVIQERKERQAAKAMASVITDLEALFNKEMPNYNSLNAQYITTAQALANTLVQGGQVDESYFLRDTLGPFQLTPKVTTPELQAKFAGLAKHRIELTAAEEKTQFETVSAAMDQALAEMSRRVNLVANEQPMTFRLPPVSVTTVQQWALQQGSSFLSAH
jgi:hypothetical protein